jgi:hypothetical protein
VTLGDADFRKSPMKMVYRKVPKNSVTTCHLSPVRTYGISLSEWEGEKDTFRPNCAARFLVDYGIGGIAT